MNEVDKLATTRLAYNGADLEYVGKARAGARTSDPRWNISRLTWSGGNLTQVLKAGGNNAAIHIWDNRDTLKYS